MCLTERKLNDSKKFTSNSSPRELMLENDHKTINQGNNNQMIKLLFAL